MRRILWSIIFLFAPLGMHNILYANNNSQNDSILIVIKNIISLYEEELYHEVLLYAELNNNLIRNHDTNSKGVIDSYINLSLWNINGLTWDLYNKKEFENAEKSLAPIIPSILEKVSVNDCNLEFCQVWSSCLRLYGHILEKLNKIDESLFVLNLEYDYVKNNLKTFLNHPKGYTKQEYIDKAIYLSIAYQKAGYFQKGILLAKEILDYCKNNLKEYNLKAINNLAYRYMASDKPNEYTDSVSVYQKKVLDILKKEEITNESIFDYTSALRILLMTLNIGKKYHEIINAINEYALPWNNYMENLPLSKLLIDIYNIKASAFDALNYKIEGSYEEMIKIHTNIINFYKEQKLEQTEMYASQLKRYANSLKQNTKNSLLIDSLYRESFKVWENLPRTGNSEFFSLLVWYLNHMQGKQANNTINSDKNSNKNDSIIHELGDKIEKVIPTLNKAYNGLIIDYYQKQTRYYLWKGDINNAKIFNDKALSLCDHNSEERFSQEYLLATLTERAIIFAQLNNWTELDEICNRIPELLKNTPNKTMEHAEALGALAINYFKIANYEKGYSLYQDMLNMMYQLGKSKNEKDILDIGYLHTLQIAFPSYSKERLEISKSIIDIIEKGGYKHNAKIFDIYINYAFDLSLNKEYEQADSIIDKIKIDIESSYERFVSQKDYNSSLARYYNMRSSHERRKQNLIQAAKFQEIANELNPHYSNHGDLTCMYAFLNQNQLYEQNLTKMLDGIKEDIETSFLYLSEYERRRYLEDGDISMLNGVFEYTHLMSNSILGIQKIYDSALLYKGLLLNTSIEIRDIINHINNDSIRNIFNELQEIKRSDTRNTDIVKTKEKSVLKHIRKHSKYEDLNITWDDIKKNLKANECAVEFLKFKKNQWVWCKDSIDKNVHYVALMLSPKFENPIYIYLFDESVLNKAIKYGSNLYRNDYGKYLEELIWGKIKQNVGGVETIYFSPIGLLNIINIEALNNDNIKYVRLSSTREICKNREDHIQTAILYGGLTYNGNELLNQETNIYAEIEDDLWYNLNDTTIRGTYNYLPGTKVEVRKIEELLNKVQVETSCLTGLQGDIESFRRLSGASPSLLHVATHAVWNEDNDELSLKNGGLLLSSSEKYEETPIHERKNFICAEEISTMDLSNTSLAVLSACQTGVGKITDDGVWGIQRAFKMAGVKSILMSLWKVDDIATALMMTTFYKEWLSTGDKYKAFKYAQSVVKKRFDNPFYWAAFILLD